MFSFSIATAFLIFLAVIIVLVVVIGALHILEENDQFKHRIATLHKIVDLQRNHYKDEQAALNAEKEIERLLKQGYY